MNARMIVIKRFLDIKIPVQDNVTISSPLGSYLGNLAPSITALLIA